MNGVNNLPVNSRGQQFSAKLENQTDIGDCDILVFSRIGDLKTGGQDKTGQKTGFFKASSNGFFKKFFKHKATSRDVIDIFMTAGMSKEQASKACQEVRDSSKARKLSGFSADMVRQKIKDSPGGQSKTSEKP